MVEPSQIRKCYEICRIILKNAAYYRGGASLSNDNKPKTQFAVVASNNFLDMAYLNWCKLFWRESDKHHYRKILTDPEAFKASLLKAMNMDEGGLKAFATTIAHYRDKEIAHADVYDVIDIPELDMIVTSTIVLYEALRADCGMEPAPPAPYDLQSAFRSEESLARSSFVALADVAG